ncbi:hypothetical protein BJX61DRAFT_417402 [Aspergillus egyptiacus]|nr:hypothetical protein BJX61DRAFT_417402 [Aspergillus egyptiacus]
MPTSRQIQPEEIFSDESSFYGDDEEVSRLEELAASYDPEHYWTSIHPKLLSTIQSRQQLEKKMESSPMDIDAETPQFLPRNRHGRHESASDFLTRLPPSTTKAETIGPWIYASNLQIPYKEGDLPTLQRKGRERLERFEDEEAHVRYENDQKGGTKQALGRRLAPLRRKLEQDIFVLARETGIVTGKWMMFITADRVDHYWGVVAAATMNGELGIGAKVATDDGQGRARLIAIYTKDYQDRDDIKRVLRRLMELDMVKRNERPIYYKCDVLTYLEILSDNPYGLKASSFSSADVLAGKV